jgi:hypothetical protein
MSTAFALMVPVLGRVLAAYSTVYTVLQYITHSLLVFTLRCSSYHHSTYHTTSKRTPIDYARSTTASIREVHTDKVQAGLAHAVSRRASADSSRSVLTDDNITPDRTEVVSRRAPAYSPRVMTEVGYADSNTQGLGDKVSWRAPAHTSRNTSKLVHVDKIVGCFLPEQSNRTPV